MKLVLAVLAASLVCAAAGAAPSGDFPLRLEDLSGSWTGKETMESLGSCTFGDGAPVTVALDIVVAADGKVKVKRAGALLGTGDVSPTWHVAIAQPARATCGDEDRTYDTAYEGLFTQKGDALHLELEGVDTPCPPDCSFRRRIKVKRVRDDGE